MSIFWIGGPEGIILPLEKMNTTEEDRYFLPGVIHGGENYMIQVYAWNNDGTPEGERIGAKYLFVEDILEWAKEATMEDGSFNSDIFEECINEGAEEFVIENDGTGDFVSLNEKWGEAKSWDYARVISWAESQLEKLRDSADKAAMELVSGNIKVEWVDIGEGLCGDYNPDDPEDIPLLRFDISVFKDGEWEIKSDGSHCTQFPTTATNEEKATGLAILMNRVREVLQDDLDAPIKKLAEELSWIDLEAVERVKKKRTLDERIHAASVKAEKATGESVAKEDISKETRE